MTHKTLLILALSCAFLSITSCSDDDEKLPDNEEVVTPSLEEVLSVGMIKITENIGDWDVGVIYDEEGYIMLKEDPEESDEESYLQIMSPAGLYDCALYFHKDDCLPKMLICGDETRYFDYVDDSLLIVSQAQEEGVAVVDTLIYIISQTDTHAEPGHVTIVYNAYLDDNIQKVIKALDAVLKAGDDYTSSQMDRLTDALDNISGAYYYENVEDIIDDLDLCKEADSDDPEGFAYCFSQYATSVKEDTYNSATFGITVTNDINASDVTAHEATVGGRIYCASSDFRTYGTWGIIYSTNPDELTLDNEEGIVYADTEASAGSKTGDDIFSFRLTGLQAETTYYYKAFYKFNSNDHGALYFRYGDKDAESYVESDSFMGKFTTDKDSGTINGHEYVDLGLSVKWATCNVGASSPSDYGNYYAWGETSTKSSYTANNCKTWEVSIGNIAGNSSYDAARANWGGTWRLPTLDEIDELTSKCTTEWTRVDGVNGRKVTGPNGNSIFLPAAGWRGGTSLYVAGFIGLYWSATPDEGDSQGAYYLNFYSGYFGRGWGYRGNGFSVRAVSD